MLRALATVALLLSGCSAPIETPDSEPAPASSACEVGDVSLVELARAEAQSQLVVTTRTLRVLPLSPFVQSPPPATGDTVLFVVAGEITEVMRGPGTLGERVDYVLAAPFSPDWQSRWAEGSEWTAWLTPRDGRVRWQALRAPLSMASEAQAMLTGASTWPAPGLQLMPSVAVETVAGGVSAASGYLFTLKSSLGDSVRLRLTDLVASEPALWALPEGTDIWQQVTPCSLAGARLHLALPSLDEVRLSGEGARDGFDRLMALLPPVR